ncbi:hypothetical protein AHF37_07731 [Paragonimus kellicotti]|nr:hypothetical protein AHF37_07731 [Paragonimus kellicotti]
MSDRICIASEGKSQPKLSAENLVACCDSCGMGCNGGFPASAWRYWTKHGIVTGGLYNTTDTCQPYSFPPCEHHVVGPRPPCGGEVETPTCQSTCQKKYPLRYEQDLWYGKFIGNFTNQMKLAMFVHICLEGYSLETNYMHCVYELTFSQ